MTRANRSIQYQKISTDRWETQDAEVIAEAPVSLTVNGEVWLAFMCTPIDLEAMAVGFLYNEGLIEQTSEIASVRTCQDGSNVDVWLHHAVEKPEKWRRTSGCTGGVTAVEPANGKLPSLSAGPILTPSAVGCLIGRLFESQSLYRVSGGVHTSALSDGGRLLVVAEDIGRHNTLDKIAGRLLLEQVKLDQRILLTTGRISSEMLQKSVRLGASVVISRTSPSSLSVEMAEKWGVTLIGYAHRNRFNLYTHPQRIQNQNNTLHWVENVEKKEKTDCYETL